jgi:hypothetical protein
MNNPYDLWSMTSVALSVTEGNARMPAKATKIMFLDDPPPPADFTLPQMSAMVVL